MSALSRFPANHAVLSDRTNSVANSRNSKPSPDRDFHLSVRKAQKHRSSALPKAPPAPIDIPASNPSLSKVLDGENMLSPTLPFMRKMSEKIEKKRISPPRVKRSSLMAEVPVPNVASPQPDRRTSASEMRLVSTPGGLPSSLVDGDESSSDEEEEGAVQEQVCFGGATTAACCIIYTYSLTNPPPPPPCSGSW